MRYISLVLGRNVNINTDTANKTPEIFLDLWIPFSLQSSLL
ncbi:hypothetical protein M104_2202 [Bacteroides fragilis str. 1007-1-F |uniref:Uncharacterized protein n=1 Tax=Bacteroides fragilis str. 1007-1-F \|nr:hypothetical protein M101_2162 [Bacteroides fragilis str. 1007-1-F \